MLIVDTPSSWPPGLLESVNSPDIVELLKSYEWMDNLIEEPAIRRLCRAVDEHAELSGVAGFHCTKEISSRPYKFFGLRVLNMEQHHYEFLAYLRKELRAHADLYARIEETLRDFRDNHPGRREGMLWFCLSEALTLNSGCDRFFEWYGGEAIYWPFEKDEEVCAFLRQIGRPVVVKARVQFRNLRIYRDYALGRSIISLCAVRVNPGFNAEYAEGNVTEGIPPDDIVDVYDAQDFRNSVQSTDRWSGAV